MRIKKYVLGELQANCYLVSWDNRCILIDPADDAAFLLEELSRQNLQLTAMFATHGHFDHLMAAGEIQLSITAPLYIHRNDLFLVRRLKETAHHFLGYMPHMTEPHLIKEFKEMKMKIDTTEIKIIEAPGHTPGGVVYFFKEDKTLFTGDTLFDGAVGRTDLSYSCKKDLYTSINHIIKMLPEETVIYPGHGEETTVLEAKRFFHF